MQQPSIQPHYKRLEGVVPVIHPPSLDDRALELLGILQAGDREMAGLLDVEPPALQALLVANEDWQEAPRDNVRPYPPGLPYFTRATPIPTLVLPGRLSPVFGPQTEATLPLTVWHELVHAFLLQRDIVRTPAWLQEFVSQAVAAAVARRTGLTLEEHLSQVPNMDPDVRAFGGPADARRQMASQNALLALGNAAIEEFGEEFLKRLVRALWDEENIVGGRRAEELLAEALGDGGKEWLARRPEFREER